MEGVVILHEVVHELKKTKKRGLILKIDFEKAYDKVRWDFLEQVMRGEGFPEEWITWVMQTVRGGRVCVHVNGQRGPYFRTFQGLRQGDPLSPMLFNIVADVLSVLVDKAAAKNIISGVLADLVPGGITHIQYAGDTVVMIDGSECAVTNLKLILYCFEWLAGLKINFHKSDVFVFGVDQSEKENLANMLNCRLGEWPMRYLGIPISENRLGIQAFAGLGDKMSKRLDPWKGKHLSSGGRLVLTNSCLSSLPMYTMGFYLLPKGTHEQMDKHRSHFFWQGASDDFKYHMAQMDSLCRPKDQGGLGMVNTKIMNDTLLVKWIWKITQGSEGTWYRLLRAKYMTGGNFFNSKSRGSS